MSRVFTYSGVFLVALASLMLEILLTRITSVVAWYHLAFFVISLGMLGMTAGAVLVFVFPQFFSDDVLAARMRQSALAFGLSIPVCLGMALAMPLTPVTDLMSFVALCNSAAAFAVPFVLGGITLTLALTRAGLPANRVYAVDLLGAAAGCLLVIPLLGAADAASAALVTGAVAALSAACFSLAEGRRPVLPVLSALLVGGLALANAASPAPPFRPAWVKGFREDLAMYEYLGWNSYSRITVERERVGPPTFWAKGERTPAALRPLRQRTIRIDGAAATVMTHMGASAAEHDYLEWDISNFAHRIRPSGPAAVIGVGGGRDVLAALQAGHKPVVGVELNSLIARLHRGGYADFSGLADAPGFELVADEARSHLARETRRFDTLTMSLIDTWASTGAGAYSLSENGLYTREAWSLFLDRLTPTGVFTVSRWYVARSPGETARMLVLAMDTLWERGVDRPRDHLVMVQNALVSTLLVSPSPFSSADIDRVEQEADKRGFRVLLSPRVLPAHPMLKGVAASEARATMHAWAEQQLLDMSVPTDARPFFFNMLRPRTWLLGQAAISQLDLPALGNLRSTQTLVYATLISLLLTLVTVVLPLALRRRALRPFPRLDLLAACGYFALIGLGFMCVEIGILSHLNVFIGHPTLALAVLLGGIIFFAGLGSLLSGRVAVQRAAVAWTFPLLPASCVLLEGFLLVPVMNSFVAAPEGTRILVSLALLAPPALGLGMCFPLGLRLVERMEAAITARAQAAGHAGPASPLGPWLWGVNGACGVCASGLALGVSMTWGIPTTLMVGAGCYLLLPLLSAHIQHAGR